jgi:hypothetical protein
MSSISDPGEEKFCPNNTQKWNSASSTQNWGGEFSIGTLGKFHPALTRAVSINATDSLCTDLHGQEEWRSSGYRVPRSEDLSKDRLQMAQPIRV